MCICHTTCASKGSDSTPTSPLSIPKPLLSQRVRMLSVEIKGLSLCCLAHEFNSSSANQTGTQSCCPWLHSSHFLFLSFKLSSFFYSFFKLSLSLSCCCLFFLRVVVALTCPCTLHSLEFVSCSLQKELSFHSHLNLLLSSGTLSDCSTPCVAIRRRCLTQPITLHKACLTRWISTASRPFGIMCHICYLWSWLYTDASCMLLSLHW